jgi:hypothetical protein
LPELEVRIYNLEQETKHTIQIILKMKSMLFQVVYLNNKNIILWFFFKERKKYHSDLINFTVPMKNDKEHTEVLNILAEPVPDELLGLF